MVLDCRTDTAKRLVMSHVRDVRMGRRNWLYLLSGLVRICGISYPQYMCKTFVFFLLFDNW